MGNSHPGAATSSATKSPSKLSSKLLKHRRLSDPSQNQNVKNCHLAPGSSNTHPSATPPTIQINGKESFDDFEHGQLRAKSASTDFSSLRSTSSSSSSTKNTASERRKVFLSSSMNQEFIARSLDDSMTAKMCSMIRTKSHSPLKQMRTYSFRSISSEENLIDKESCEAVTESWRLVESRSAAVVPGGCFGLFILRRVFAKIPILCSVFGVSEAQDIFDLPESHPVRRHARLFTNILHISVKSVDELEAQVAPTVFKYGERHYRPDIIPHMTEENVRIFCAQIVCTVFDFLREAEATPKCAESWIELMRYLGQKLLDGFEFAKLTAERKISINRNDHHLFLML